MYNWILVFHIISLVSWFAVLFYLPRLFVYHAEHTDNAGFVEVAKIMERKLYKYIGIPGFWGTIISGTLLIVQNPALLSSGGWLHAKISLVVVLSVYFFHLGRLRHKLATDECSKSGKFFRVYNEVPTLLLIAIVILVIIKPF
jgi:putative membrane protein